MKELDEAENDFSKVIELFPDYIDAWVNRSIVRYEKGDTQGAESDRYKSREIMELISNDSKNIDSLYNVYSNAIDYDKIIAFDSDFINGDRGGKLAQFSTVDIKPFDNFIVAVSEFNPKGKNKKDKRQFVDATLSQINESKQLNGMYLVYMQKENNNENYQSFLNDSIIESVSDNDLKVFLSALMNYEIHNYQHAERNLYQLISNNIYNVYASINIAAIQKDKAELILAKENYNDPVSINIKKTNEKRNINNPVKPDYQQALNTLSDLVSEQSTNPFIWYNLGNIHLQMQEFHKAIDDYSLAIKYEKNLAEAYYNRGLTLLFLGEKDLANSDLSKAGELGIKEAYAVIKRYINN
jgi:tetratricopeptide (TPR) repeat protein